MGINHKLPFAFGTISEISLVCLVLLFARAAVPFSLLVFVFQVPYVLRGEQREQGAPSKSISLQAGLMGIHIFNQN